MSNSGIIDDLFLAESKTVDDYINNIVDQLRSIRSNDSGLEGRTDFIEDFIVNYLGKSVEDLFDGSIYLDIDNISLGAIDEFCYKFSNLVLDCFFNIYIDELNLNKIYALYKFFVVDFNKNMALYLYSLCDRKSEINNYRKGNPTNINISASSIWNDNLTKTESDEKMTKEIYLSLNENDKEKYQFKVIDFVLKFAINTKFILNEFLISVFMLNNKDDLTRNVAEMYHDSTNIFDDNFIYKRFVFSLLDEDSVLAKSAIEKLFIYFNNKIDDVFI